MGDLESRLMLPLTSESFHKASLVSAWRSNVYLVNLEPDVGNDYVFGSDYQLAQDGSATLFPEEGAYSGPEDAAAESSLAYKAAWDRYIDETGESPALSVNSDRTPSSPDLPLLADAALYPSDIASTTPLFDAAMFQTVPAPLPPRGSTSARKPFHPPAPPGGDASGLSSPALTPYLPPDLSDNGQGSSRDLSIVPPQMAQPDDRRSQQSARSNGYDSMQGATSSGNAYSNDARLHRPSLHAASSFVDSEERSSSNRTAPLDSQTARSSWTTSLPNYGMAGKARAEPQDSMSTCSLYPRDDSWKLTSDMTVQSWPARALRTSQTNGNSSEASMTVSPKEAFMDYDSTMAEVSSANRANASLFSPMTAIPAFSSYASAVPSPTSPNDATRASKHGYPGFDYPKNSVRWRDDGSGRTGFGQNAVPQPRRQGTGQSEDSILDNALSPSVSESEDVNSAPPPTFGQYLGPASKPLSSSLSTSKRAAPPPPIDPALSALSYDNAASKRSQWTSGGMPLLSQAAEESYLQHRGSLPPDSVSSTDSAASPRDYFTSSSASASFSESDRSSGPAYTYGRQVRTPGIDLSGERRTDNLPPALPSRGSTPHDQAYASRYGNQHIQIEPQAYDSAVQAHGRAASSHHGSHTRPTVTAQHSAERSTLDEEQQALDAGNQQPEDGDVQAADWYSSHQHGEDSKRRRAAGSAAASTSAAVEPAVDHSTPRRRARKATASDEDDDGDYEEDETSDNAPPAKKRKAQTDASLAGPARSLVQEEDTQRKRKARSPKPAAGTGTIRCDHLGTDGKKCNTLFRRPYDVRPFQAGPVCLPY